MGQSTIFKVCASVFILFTLGVFGGKYTWHDEVLIFLHETTHLVVPVIVALFALHFQTSYKKYLPHLLSNRTLCIYLSLVGASALWSADPQTTLTSFLYFYCFTSVAVGFSYTIGKEDFLLMILRALKWSMVLSVICAIFIEDTRYGAASVFTTDFIGLWRGAFAHKNRFGHMAGLLILLITFLSIYKRSVSPGNALFFLLGCFLLVKANSSTAVIGVLVSLLMASVYAFNRSFFIYSLVVGLCLLEYALLYLPYFGKDDSFTGRTAIWESSLMAAAEKPILGYGFNSFWVDTLTTENPLRQQFGDRLNSAHNSFIEVALMLGAVGVILCCTIYYKAFRAIISDKYVHPEQKALNFVYFPILVYFLLIATMESAIFLQVIYWVVLVYLSSLSPISPLTDQELPPEEDLFNKIEIQHQSLSFSESIEASQIHTDTK